MQNKHGFIYIWMDIKKKRFYVGSHWGTEDDGYICSSKWMRDTYRRRPQDFKRRIIQRVFTNRTDLLNEEYKWLLLIDDAQLGKKYFNLNKHRQSHWSENKSKTVREKLKEAWTDQRRELQSPKLSKALKGNTNKRGKKLSDESRKRISESKMGNTHSKGIPKSDETKRKISETAKSQNRVGNFKGRTHSEETKRKMSESRKNKLTTNGD